MPAVYQEPEHQELFVPDADLTQPIKMHIPSALGTLPYVVCLRVADAYADRLDDVSVHIVVGGLRPDDVTVSAGEEAPDPNRIPSRESGLVWALLCRAHLSRGDGELVFQHLPDGLTRADVLLCTWPRFLATGQADEWLACQEDPAWASGGIPLGGIGAGKVEISRDGRFRNFSGNNNQDMPFEEPDGMDGAFLSVCAGGEERILATRPMAGLAPAPTLEADLAFPQATLTARNVAPDLDVSVRLAGPTVPQDTKLACLPGCLLRWTLRNRGASDVEATVRFAWPNRIGAGGGIHKPETDIGKADGLYRYFDAPDGHTGEAMTGNGYSALVYDNTPNPVSIQADGRYFVALRAGTPDAVDADATRGSIRAILTVPAGGEATAEMALAWEMPHWVDSLQEDRGLYWTNHYADGPAIIEALFAQADTIFQEGAALRSLLAETDLPDWLQKRLCNCNYPLVTSSVFYRDGRFSINEGPTEMMGCYGTIDQRLGAHPGTQLFFPSLNRQELQEFADYQDDNGGINHDLGGGHLERGKREQPWPDLTCSFILQTARHAWSTAEAEFENEMWERAKRAMDRHAIWAEAGNGVAQVGKQTRLGTSYDGYHYEGTTPYMATLWIAALLVMREWAGRRGEDGLFPEIDKRIEAARQRMEADLWTGSYYRAYGSQDGPVNENAHAGMLAGEPYARMLAGADVLPGDRLDACTDALVRLNGSDRFRIPPDEVAPDGACEVEYGWLPYVECFGLAALAVRREERFFEVWQRVLAAMDGGGKHPCDTRLMYQPISGLPSWGSYYMTAPASWIVYDAMIDFFYDAGVRRLHLVPPKSGRYPVVHPLFWGIASLDAADGSVALSVRRIFGDGTASVDSLAVPHGDGSVLVNGTACERTPWTAVHDLVQLNEPFLLEADATLTWTAQS